jgi:hypothetical protein
MMCLTASASHTGHGTDSRCRTPRLTCTTPCIQRNGQPVPLGWHTFRHKYRSLLDATGAPIGVQQKLMRHAQVATTMDVYGNALMESKREANSKVVALLLRPFRDSQSLRP